MNKSDAKELAPGISGSLEGFDPRELLKDRDGVARPLVELGSNGLPGVSIGTLQGFSTSGAPRVVISDHSIRRVVDALSTVELLESQVGRQVILAFVGEDPQKPVVLGIVQSPAEGGKKLRASLDGEQLVITADREIVPGVASPASL